MATAGVCSLIVCVLLVCGSVGVSLNTSTTAAPLMISSSASAATSTKSPSVLLSQLQAAAKSQRQNGPEVTRRQDFIDSSDDLLKGKTLKAVTVLEDPYATKKVTDEGTDFHGFVIDIVKELSSSLGFDFELYVSPDGKYGAPKENNTQWSGVIGEIMSGRADVAVAPVTISSEREQVVDFTNPFMDLGAGLLMKKPEPEGTSIFAFLQPFKGTVWFSILGALLGTAILLYVTSRLRFKCDIGDQNYYNDRKFNFKNSLWLTYWSIVRKGGEPAPRSLPSRILAGAWWFFTLIVISTYTANLTAFLTVKRLVSPIKSIDDLASQNSIPFGVTQETFLYSFFKGQVDTGSVYERMWDSMQTTEMFPPSSMKGVEWVRAGRYVLIEETPFLEYTVRTDQNCELMLLGKPFLFKGYGFATRRGSAIKKQLSVGILKLQESGKMSELRDKWWPKDGCPLDGQSSNVNEASALGLDIFLGVFYVLGAAAILAVVVTAVQVIYYRFCNFGEKLKKMNSNRRTSLKNHVLRRQSTDVNLH
ncbi:glutamate receptor ionotropic, kainate 2-like [Branchiostoma floridae]|uniref:Glutamate receptor ionotropic, kainate 2-like n=1 Tax=Branchiostoma floridae TaxID=7739 RepID=A0A9J7MLH2_BRAFL|nr:glutamate receptor ionotropic, kainate 2-like [Branchiostoma floridae]